jgi:uncharacterized protein YaaN involved in tellurite resistance
MEAKEKEILESNTKLANEVLEKQRENTNVNELDYSLSTLKETDRVKAVQIMKGLDESNYSSLDDFGKEVYSKVNQNANEILGRVKGKDIAGLDVGLETMLDKINSISLKDLKRADPGQAFWNDFFGFARRRLYKLKNHYSSLEAQVDSIADTLNLSVEELRNDNKTYEAIKIQAKETFEQLNAFIAAGDAKVLELTNTINENNKALEADNTSNKMTLATQANSLISYQTRLRKKTQDMKNLQFYLAFVQYPTITRLQEDNELVINNIKDTIDNGLPVYKTNLTAIIGALKTRKAIEQNAAAREMLNKQILMGVNLLNENTDKTNEESMKTTIDTQVIIEAAQKIQAAHDKWGVARNNAVKAFDQQSKALEEATNTIKSHLKSMGGIE